LELDPPKLDVFPVALLHRLLRTNEQLVMDFTQKYFSKALMSFLDSQKKTEQYLRQSMGLPAGGGLMTDWAKLMLTPFDPAAWASASAPATNSQPATPPPPDPAMTEQIRQLEEKIVQLQHRLKRQKRAPGGKKAKRSVS
jgi:hypothetical protein